MQECKLWNEKFPSELQAHCNLTFWNTLYYNYDGNVTFIIDNMITSLAPLKSGSPVCISTSIQPRLHMSIANPYGMPSNTSGDL